MGEWNMLELWRSMGTLCHGVVIVLAIMFVRSVGVSASRALRYRLAREQSKAYIFETVNSFREGKLDQAIVAAEGNKKSHIANIVTAGLLDFQAAPEGMPEQQVIEGVQRSLERSSAETTEEMKRGLSGLATIAATAPFVGLFGTVIGILNAFRSIDVMHATAIKVIAGSISEALLTTAEWEALDGYSQDIGLAFQIQDDILDVEGSTEDLGKTIGADAARAKPTYPSILGLEAAKIRARELRQRAGERLALFGGRAQVLTWLASYVVDRRV